MFSLIKNFKNKFDFFLRKSIKFSRKIVFLKNEQKEELFVSFEEQKRTPAIQKEAEYLEKYFLNEFKQNTTRRNYLENLATIELLENHLEISENNIRILDIGSKNWFYARGEYSFFKYKSKEKNILLNGIEIDAYRVYTNLHSRYDLAMYNIKELDNTFYIVGDLLEHREKYDFIIWFFPFVTIEPLLNWGLPLDCFKPEKMLLHAYSLLNNGGKMLIVNQDENEYRIQHAMLKNLALNYTPKGDFRNSFLEYEHGRFVTVVKKNVPDAI